MKKLWIIFIAAFALVAATVAPQPAKANISAWWLVPAFVVGTWVGAATRTLFRVRTSVRIAGTRGAKCEENPAAFASAADGNFVRYLNQETSLTSDGSHVFCAAAPQ